MFVWFYACSPDGGSLTALTTDVQGERRGVPQYNQPHVLLLGGKRILEKYSPGFESECAAKGAVMWDLLENMVRVSPPPHSPSSLKISQSWKISKVIDCL